MKKIFIYSAAAMLLGLASCSQEEMPVPVTGDGNVNFTVSLSGAEFGTRAFGDGYSARILKYAVYDNTTNFGGPSLIKEGEAEFGTSSLTTTISLDLSKGQTYNIAFFAYDGGTVYTFDAENKCVSINYADMSTTSSLKKDNDCFYALEKVEVGSNPVSRQVILTRPMAQVNWGTSDMNDESVTNIYTRLRTKFKTRAYSKLNLLDGSASEEVDVEPKKQVDPIGTSYGSFPVDGYTYLNMGYLLVPEGTSLIDCELELYNSTSFKTSFVVTNVPVERNYRTNIFGKLLTTKTDFEVTKDPIYGGDHDVENWNGQPGVMPEEVDGVYSVSTASQLAAVAQYVNSGNSMEGKTVKLVRDIDLNNQNWTPIGKSGLPFNGKFDGNGHTVKNLYINLAGKPADYAGLFGYTWTGVSEFADVTLENVNIDVTGAAGASKAVAGLVAGGSAKSITNVTATGVTIKGYHYAGAIAGNYYGNISDCDVEDIEIQLALQQLDNGKYDFGDKAGAICGFHGEGTYTLSGNSATNVRISGFRDLGGLFGMLHENNTYSGNTSDTVSITVVTENSDNLVDDSKPANFGPIVGRKGANTVDGGSNTNSNYTLYEPTTNITTLDLFKSAIEKGGYMEVAPNTTITVPAYVTISKPSVINVPEGSKISVGDNRITNTSDMRITGKGIVEGSSFVVVNGNGGKLTIDGGEFSSTSTLSNTNTVHNEGNLVVNGGKFKAANGAALACNFVNGNTGTMVINGGEFTNSAKGSYAVIMRGAGDFEINGGTFIGNFGGVQVESSSAYKVKTMLISGGTFICNGSGNYYALAVDAEGSSAGSSVTIEGGKFWSVNSTLFARTASGSILNIKGGKFKSLDSYTVANGFSTSAISESETVTAGGMSVDATYTVEVK